MLPLVGNSTSVATGFEVSVPAAGRTDILQSYNLSTRRFKLNLNSVGLIVIATKIINL